jgi:addiction module HigA family antidote
MANAIPAPHPGETLGEDVLEPLGMSVRQLATALDVEPARLDDILHGRKGLTTDTALRLARYLGTAARILAGPTARIRFAHDPAMKCLRAHLSRLFE